MFSSGLQAIYKKISSIKDKDQQNENYNYLENQLLNNPYINHQFDLMTSLKSKQNKITTQESFDAFVKGLKEKHSKFLKENKDASQLTIWKENKKLLEYFGVNPKDVNIDQYDAAIDIYSTAKGLNEGIIKGIVKKRLNSSLKYTKKVIKEEFSVLKLKENALILDKQFKIINFLSESMQQTQQKLVKTALRSLQEERYKNYPSCVDKLYKLRLLTEKMSDDLVDTDLGVGQYGGGKRVRVSDLQYIKRIEIITPSNWKRPEKIMMSFRIPVYPVGLTRNAAMTSALKLKDRINKLERIFVNATIYQKNRTQYFDPIGTIWEVSMREQVAPGQKTDARLTVYLNTAKESEGTVNWDQFKTLSYDLLKDFDKILPRIMDKLGGMLTPAEQKAELKGAKGMSKQDKQDYGNKNGMIDPDLLRRKTGSGTEDFEDRNDDFGGVF